MILSPESLGASPKEKIGFLTAKVVSTVDIYKEVGPDSY